ncbi:hypothetical protein BZG36_04483 [Bifiguratus adelaidae]|uniref:Uncharacterized protein n=1 Tax=Bifiguratus adelaidae TaxID=1938954 RepID=A0A261XYE3_9FUNG|nr:hypothetical protein BZG36_04483 [Bifiguratus adelaidae]
MSKLPTLPSSQSHLTSSLHHLLPTLPHAPITTPPTLCIHPHLYILILEHSSLALFRLFGDLDPWLALATTQTLRRNTSKLTGQSPTNLVRDGLTTSAIIGLEYARFCGPDQYTIIGTEYLALCNQVRLAEIEQTHHGGDYRQRVQNRVGGEIYIVPGLEGVTSTQPMTTHLSLSPEVAAKWMAMSEMGATADQTAHLNLNQ